jgi:hypothetical protein
VLNSSRPYRTARAVRDSLPGAFAEGCGGFLHIDRLDFFREAILDRTADIAKVSATLRNGAANPRLRPDLGREFLCIRSQRGILSAPNR